MDNAAVAAAAQAANQAAAFGAALRLNMANAIAAQLSLYIHDSFLEEMDVSDRLINKIADCSVRLADAVIVRCKQPPPQYTNRRGALD